jgi:hypothetical protein
MALIGTQIGGASLQQFIGATESEIAAGLTKSRLEAAAHDDSAAFQAWVSKSAAGGTRAELAGHVVGFLQGNAGEIFAGAWARCAELRKAAAETKDKKGVTQLVALADHEFTYSVEPEVDVLVDGMKLGGFKFSVELTCAVKGLELQVREGGIGGVRCGECEGEATISLCGVELWSKPLLHVDLPGALQWNHVLRIA